MPPSKAEYLLKIERQGRRRIAEPDRYGRIIESPSVNRLIKEYSNSNVRLVICDPLSLLGPGERFVNDGEIEVARICRNSARRWSAPC
jgi:hypothetical protein